MNGDPRYKQLLDEMWELHDSKALAYGNTGDPLANLRSGERFSVPAWKRCVVEADSAFFRVENYCNGRNASNESIENALKDAAAFCLLALLFIREGNERAERYRRKRMEELGFDPDVPVEELQVKVAPDPALTRSVEAQLQAERLVTNPEWMDGVADRMQATLEAAK